jgi:hypothetical protein
MVPVVDREQIAGDLTEQLRHLDPETAGLSRGQFSVIYPCSFRIEAHRFVVSPGFGHGSVPGGNPHSPGVFRPNSPSRDTGPGPENRWTIA